MDFLDNTQENIDFSKEYWRLDKLTDLRSTIPKIVENQLGYEHAKIQTFLKRAFTRNIFNIVRLGKSPFHDLIKAKDLISDKDVEDLFSNKIIEKTYDLNWTWLDKDLEKIYKGPTRRLSKVFIKVKFDGKYVILRGNDKPIKISKIQYDNAKKNYILDKFDIEIFHNYLYLVAARYIKIGSTNHHCSLPPSVITFSLSKMELFGSPINTCSEQYCSPFYDIEKVFGSAGSFFTFELSSGIYSLDPPYDDDIMACAMERAIEMLETVKNITFICCIPVWDQESQIKHGFKVHAKENFRALSIAQESKFLCSSEVLEKQLYPFYHYFLDQYIGVSNTHLLVLSNNNNYQLTAHDIKGKWEQLVKESPRNMGLVKNIM